MGDMHRLPGKGLGVLWNQKVTLLASTCRCHHTPQGRCEVRAVEDSFKETGGRPF